jgi:hypothetical protein
MRQNQAWPNVLVQAIFTSLSDGYQIDVMKTAFRLSIKDGDDQSAKQLFYLLYEAFGLKKEWDEKTSSVNQGVFEIERQQLRELLCAFLMKIYPHGSIREKDIVTAKLMGARKEILELIASQWDGTPCPRQECYFDFLKHAFDTGPDKIPLLGQEADMIRSVLRKRLEDSGFSEATFRIWMRRCSSASDFPVNEELFILLATARTRNGGVKTAMVDMLLNDEADRSILREVAAGD